MKACMMDYCALFQLTSREETLRSWRLREMNGLYNTDCRLDPVSRARELKGDVSSDGADPATILWYNSPLSAQSCVSRANARVSQKNEPIF